ncbi:Fc.00g034180.m01.CDS01 [Cosmosporella sp. VM-42]
MSGFEIAGAVLGSIPLLISTLEYYKNGLRTIQRWRKYDKELQSLIRNLETERVKLQNICEKLLDGLVPPSRIDAMVENPLGDLWMEEEAQKKIRARLWRSWGVFERTLRDIQTAIEEMNERLGNGVELKWWDKSLAVKELKRASFTLSRSTYADLLTAIRDGISNLESLATMNIELEPQRRVRSHVRLLNILRDLSSSIYRAVCSSLTCTCKHRVSMRLSNWTGNITPVDDEERVIQSLKVHLALSFDQLQPKESLPAATDKQAWEELLIQASPPLHTPTETSTLPRKTTECIADTANQKSKAVSFSLSRFSSFSSMTAMVETESSLVANLVTDITLGATGIALPKVQSSINLCGKLRKSPITKRPSCLGVISDQSHPNTRSYSVYSSTLSSLEGSKWRMVSLQEVLECQSGQNPLTYRQRLQLAVFISTSVLQFYKTPWMPEVPSNRNIFFIRSERFSYYDKAFVMAERDGLYSEAKIFPIIRNPTLLALGVLLIELLRGHTIDSLRIPDEILSTDLRPLSDYMTTRRLLDEVCQTSSNYGSAVRRCINGEFQRQDLNLEDEDFRQEVYCGVVALLEEDLSNL